MLSINVVYYGNKLYLASAHIFKFKPETHS